jgi:predicted RND superfamily exporter protein
VLLAWAAVLTVALLGLVRLEIDTTTSSFLDRGHPAWLAYQESLASFGGDEFLTIAIEADTPYQETTLQAVYDLTDELERLPGVRRVDSLRTVPIIEARPDGSLSLAPALEDGVPKGSQGLAALAARVRKDRIAPRNLVSDNERVFAINVMFDEDVDGARDEALARAEVLVEGHNAWISGVPVFRTKVNHRTGTELLIFVPLTLAVIGGVLLLAFGRLWSVVVALATAACGTVVALGAMGATDTPISLSTAILPSILLALGCAYVMHVLTAARGHSAGAEQAAQITAVARPVALSGLTTAIGFLAMATIRVTAIRELATYGAVGVFAVVAASLTLAPALLGLRPLDRSGSGLGDWLENGLAPRLVVWVRRRARSIAIGWLAASFVVGLGVYRLTIETDIILWFAKGTEIRDSYESIRERLAGISPMNVVVSSVDGESVTEPRALAAIDAMARYLEGRPEIGRAISVADPLRQIHRSFGGNGDGGLPGTRALTEQYLLLLESVEQIDDVITSDRHRANVVLRVNVNGSKRLVAVGELAEDWWAENGPAGFDARATGIMYEFGRAEEEIALGQIRGLMIAFGVLGIILLATLRSLPGAIGALAPNVLPLAATYGFMGMVGIPLDAATVCVGCIALGIAVDDTIHITTRYGELRTEGRDVDDALLQTFQRVLPPVVFTTIAVGTGFAVLGLSEFTLVHNFGLVTAAMVVLCLIADLTLLPAVLLAVERFRPTRKD